MTERPVRPGPTDRPGRSSSSIQSIDEGVRPRQAAAGNAKWCANNTQQTDGCIRVETLNDLHDCFVSVQHDVSGNGVVLDITGWKERGFGARPPPHLRFDRENRYRADMDANQELSQALSEARERRQTLHDALVHLEEAISSPAAGRIPAWTANVLKEMSEVQDAFAQHILVTEKPDGLYDEILERAPRLEANVRRLREEHPEIVKAIEETITRLEHVDIGKEAWPLDAARDDLQRFMGSVVRHRQRGADLVWEAYNVDIGGIE